MNLLAHLTTVVLYSSPTAEVAVMNTLQ